MSDPLRVCTKCERPFVALDRHVGKCVLCQGCKPSSTCSTCRIWSMTKWSLIIDEHSRRGSLRSEERSKKKANSQNSEPLRLSPSPPNIMSHFTAVEGQCAHCHQQREPGDTHQVFCFRCYGCHLFSKCPECCEWGMEKWASLGITVEVSKQLREDKRKQNGLTNAVTSGNQLRGAPRSAAPVVGLSGSTTSSAAARGPESGTQAVVADVNSTRSHSTNVLGLHSVVTPPESHTVPTSSVHYIPVTAPPPYGPPALMPSDSHAGNTVPLQGGTASEAIKRLAGLHTSLNELATMQGLPPRTEGLSPFAPNGEPEMVGVINIVPNDDFNDCPGVPAAVHPDAPTVSHDTPARAPDTPVGANTVRHSTTYYPSPHPTTNTNSGGTTGNQSSHSSVPLHNHRTNSSVVSHNHTIATQLQTPAGQDRHPTALPISSGLPATPWQDRNHTALPLPSGILPTTLRPLQTTERDRNPAALPMPSGLPTTSPTLPVNRTPLPPPPTTQYPRTHVVDLTGTESSSDKSSSGASKSGVSQPNFFKHAKTVYNAMLNDNISMLGLRKGTDQRLPDGSQKFVYQCNFCVSFVSSLESLLNHVQRHVFVCAVCKYQSFLRSKIVHHSLVAHSSARYNLQNLEVVRLQQDSVMRDDNDRHMRCEDLVQFVPVSPESLAPAATSALVTPVATDKEVPVVTAGVSLPVTTGRTEVVSQEPAATPEQPKTVDAPASSSEPALNSQPPRSAQTEELPSEKQGTRSRYSSGSTAPYSDVEEPLHYSSDTLENDESFTNVLPKSSPYTPYVPAHCKQQGRPTRQNKRRSDLEETEACFKKYAAIIRDSIVILEDIRGTPYMPHYLHQVINLKNINLNAAPTEAFSLTKGLSAKPVIPEMKKSQPKKTSISPAEKIARLTRRGKGDLFELPWDWSEKKMKGSKTCPLKISVVSDKNSSDIQSKDSDMHAETTPKATSVEVRCKVPPKAPPAEVKPKVTAVDIRASPGKGRAKEHQTYEVSTGGPQPPEKIIGDSGYSVGKTGAKNPKEKTLVNKDKKINTSLVEKGKGDKLLNEISNTPLDKSGSKRPILGDIWMQPMKKIDPRMEIVIPSPDRIRSVYRPDFAEPWKVAIRLLKTQGKLFSCRVCLYTSSNFTHVREHIGEVHLGLSLWMCPHCTFLSGRRVNVMDHLASDHAALDHFVIRCRNYRSGTPKQIIDSALPNLPPFRHITEEEVEHYVKDTLENRYHKRQSVSDMLKTGKLKCKKTKGKATEIVAKLNSYKCHVCSFKSSDLKLMKVHFIGKHKEQTPIDPKFGFVVDVTQLDNKNRRLFCCPSLRCTFRAHKKYVVYLHANRECIDNKRRKLLGKAGLHMSANFQCTYCYKQGSGLTIIKNHIKSYHPDQKIIVQDIKQRALKKRSLHFMCPHCSFSSPFSDQLHSHMKLHGAWAMLKPLAPLKPPVQRQSTPLANALLEVSVNDQKTPAKVIEKSPAPDTELMVTDTTKGQGTLKAAGTKGVKNKKKRKCVFSDPKAKKRTYLSHVRPSHVRRESVDPLYVPVMPVTPTHMMPVVSLQKLDIDVPPSVRKPSGVQKKAKKDTTRVTPPASTHASPSARYMDEYVDRSGLSYARCRFKCRLCQFADNSPMSIKKHILSQHEGQYIVVQDMRMKMANKPSISYLCPRCDFTSGTPKELTDHIRQLPLHAKPPPNWQENNETNAQAAGDAQPAATASPVSKSPIAVDKVPIHESDMGDVRIVNVEQGSYMSLSVMGAVQMDLDKSRSRSISPQVDNSQSRKGSPGISQHTAASRTSPRPTTPSVAIGQQDTPGTEQSASQQKTQEQTSHDPAGSSAQLHSTAERESPPKSLASSTELRTAAEREPPQSVPTTADGEIPSSEAPSVPLSTSSTAGPDGPAVNEVDKGDMSVEEISTPSVQMTSDKDSTPSEDTTMSAPVVQIEVDCPPSDTMLASDVMLNSPKSSHNKDGDNTTCEKDGSKKDRTGDRTESTVSPMDSENTAAQKGSSVDEPAAADDDSDGDNDNIDDDCGDGDSNKDSGNEEKLVEEEDFKVVQVIDDDEDDDKGQNSDKNKSGAEKSNGENICEVDLISDNEDGDGSDETNKEVVPDGDDTSGSDGKKEEKKGEEDTELQMEVTSEDPIGDDDEPARKSPKTRAVVYVETEVAKEDVIDITDADDDAVVINSDNEGENEESTINNNNKPGGVSRSAGDERGKTSRELGESRNENPELTKVLEVEASPAKPMMLFKVVKTPTVGSTGARNSLANLNSNPVSNPAMIGSKPSSVSAACPVTKSSDSPNNFVSDPIVIDSNQTSASAASPVSLSSAPTRNLVSEPIVIDSFSASSPVALNSKAVNTAVNDPIVIDSKTTSTPSDTQEGALSTNCKKFRVMSCRECNTTFNSMHQVKCHVTRAHANVEQPFVKDMSRTGLKMKGIYLCPHPECDFAGYGVNRLIQHRLEQHKEKSSAPSNPQNMGPKKGVYLRCYHCNFISIVSEVRHHLRVFHGVLQQVATPYNSSRTSAKLYLCRHLKCDFMCYQLDDYTSHKCGEDSAASVVTVTSKGLSSSKSAAWTWVDTDRTSPSINNSNVVTTATPMTPAVVNKTNRTVTSTSCGGQAIPTSSAAIPPPGTMGTSHGTPSQPPDGVNQGNPDAANLPPELELNEEGDDNWQVTLEDEEQ